MHACAKGNKNVAEKLLAAGETTDTYHRGGQTPLGIATARQHLPVVELLLDHGANAHTSGAGGRSPFLLAVNGNQRSLVQAMVRRGALQRATPDEYNAYMQKYKPGDAGRPRSGFQGSSFGAVPDHIKSVLDSAASSVPQTINPLDSVIDAGFLLGHTF